MVAGSLANGTPYEACKRFRRDGGPMAVELRIGALPIALLTR